LTISTPRKPIRLAALARLREVLRAALLLGIAALTLIGCGGGDATTATRTTAARTPGKSKGQRAVTGGRHCPLGPFLRALDTLESGLAAGLSYEQYFAEVKGARSDYESVPIDELELPCLAVGSPGERALNQYIEAANVWRECRADVRCGTYSIEPRLQRKWRVASHYIALAHEAS
jgi:hypothetical protein